MSELKLCPFCGSEAGFGHDPYSGVHWVSCVGGNCPMVAITCETPDDAAEAWNRRPLEDELLAVCSMIVAAWRTGDPDRFDDAYYAARDAIVKAKGE